jgi:DnaJ-class molecular chaperone
MSFGGRGDPFEAFLGGGGLSETVGQRRGVSYELNLSLEELYKGGTKRMKIKRNSRTVQREGEKIVEIKITPGWKAGTKITYEGEGDEIGNTGQCQDVVFIVKEKKHGLYARDGHNLILKSEINLRDALCGFTLQIPSLDGRNVQIKIDNEIINNGTTKVIKNEGMPISKRPGGDLIITFDVIFPKTLSSQQKQQLRQILL